MIFVGIFTALIACSIGELFVASEVVYATKFIESTLTRYMFSSQILQLKKDLDLSLIF